MRDFGQILTGLVKRTEEGRLKWSKTVSQDRFVASVDTIALMVGEVRNPGEPIRYSLDILNEYEEVADSIGHDDCSDAEYRELERLYRLARRTANDAEATLEKLAKILEL